MLQKQEQVRGKPSLVLQDDNLVSSLDNPTLTNKIAVSTFLNPTANLTIADGLSCANEVQLLHTSSHPMH
jgi:hypothetical protein